MAYDDQLAVRVRKHFQRRGVAFTEKRMMGGLCLMVDGKMCVGVERNHLMARVGPDAYEAALRRKGCGPMDFTGRPMRGFVSVSAEGLATEEDLSSWLDLALAFNPQAQSSKPRRR